MLTRRQKLRKVRGEVAMILPKHILKLFHLDAGHEVLIVERSDGILIMPYDPTFEEAMQHYERAAKKYKNAMRNLAQ